MDIKWLEDLIATGQTGSLAIAARQRHITQAAFDRRIRALEAWAGAPLIDRAHRTIRLTEAGKTLIGHAQDTLQALADAKAQLSRTQGSDIQTHILMMRWGWRQSSGR